MKEIQLDEGFSYGIGAFETIAVEKARPVFIDAHLKRLHAALAQLGLADELPDRLNQPEIMKYLAGHKRLLKDGRGVLKIMVSAENVVFTLRPNHYRESDYQRGFRLTASAIYRNESAPLSYLKSLCCGDNIFAKRNALSRGYDEPVFLNSRGELAEGAVSNIFFSRAGRLYTPKICCGILPGIMRGWVIQNYPVEEAVIYPADVAGCDEMFITNSLLGVMPVTQFDKIFFKSREKAVMLQKHYKKFIIEQ